MPLPPLLVEFLATLASAFPLVPVVRVPRASGIVGSVLGVQGQRRNKEAFSEIRVSLDKSKSRFEGDALQDLLVDPLAALVLKGEHKLPGWGGLTFAGGFLPAGC